MELIRNRFTNEEIDKIKNEIIKLEAEKDRKDFVWKYYEKNSNNINRLEYFVKYNDYLRKLSEELKEKDYILMKDKINFKYPGGEGFEAHQDISAGWGKYGSDIITYAIPLQNTDENNGCIYFANIGISKILTKEFCNLTPDIVSDNLYKPLLCNKGDIIKFDSYIPHKSFSNKSTKPRIILFFTYLKNPKFKDIYEKYHFDKLKNVPPDIYKKTGILYRSGNNFNKIIYQK